MLEAEFRPNLKRVIRIVRDDQFRAYRDNILDFQRRSRAHRGDPVELLFLQAEMAREVIHLQKQQREYAKKIEDGDTSLDYEGAIDLHKGLTYVIKNVADGVAWRSLAYDRALIHELADAHSTGHMHLESASAELEEATQHLVDTGNLVLLNDLTNFLRYGDFTSVSDDSIGIHEVKAGAASKGDRRASRQKRRTAELIEFINRGEKNGPFGKHKLMRSGVTPRSYLSALPALIAEARMKGNVSARLSDCIGRPGAQGMLVSVGALGRMFQEFLDEECFADQHEEIIDSDAFEEATMYAAFEQESTLWD